MENKPKKISKEEHKEIMWASARLMFRAPVSLFLIFMFFIVFFGVVAISSQYIMFAIFPIYFSFGLMSAYVADHGESLSISRMISNIKYNAVDIFKESTHIFAIGALLFVVSLLLFPSGEDNHTLSVGWFSTDVSASLYFLLCYYIIGGTGIYSIPLMLFGDLSHSEAGALSYNANRENSNLSSVKYYMMGMYLLFSMFQPASYLLIVLTVLYLPFYHYRVYRAVFFDENGNKELEENYVEATSVG